MDKFTGDICNGDVHCDSKADEVCVDGQHDITDKVKENKLQFGTCWLHKELVCDGIKNCPDGADEDPYKCRHTYITRNIAPQYGSVECLSSNTLRNPGIRILGVRCNKHEECLGGEDETSCEFGDVIKLMWVGCGVASVMVFYAMLITLLYVLNRGKTKKTTSAIQPPSMLTENGIKNLLDNLLHSKEGTEQESDFSQYPGSTISVVFSYIIPMEYEKRKIAAKIFVSNIMRNDCVLWMKTKH